MVIRRPRRAVRRRAGLDRQGTPRGAVGRREGSSTEARSSLTERPRMPNPWSTHGSDGSMPNGVNRAMAGECWWMTWTTAPRSGPCAD